ncbi:MAG: cytochrome P450 [Pseudomonadota bacterium]
MATADLSIGTAPKKRAPIPPTRFPFGNLGPLRRDPFGFLLHCRAGYGDLVRLKLFTTTAFLFSHPDLVQHILQKKQPVYDKDLQPLKRLKPVLGDGMVTADGEVWKHQRDVAKPAFHAREVQSFGPEITEVIADTIAHWREAAVDGRVLDMHHEMMHITLRVAGRALFGVDLGAEAEVSSNLLNATMAAGLKRMNALVAAPMMLPTRNNRLLKTARRSLERMIDRIIERRQEEGRDGEDLFGRLLEDHGARERPGRTRQFYDEAITILLAGHETTANALSFSLHLLGRHREIAARLREETRQVLAGRPATFEDIPSLAFTRMVLDEAMRLYPPAWLIDRNAVEDDEIDGYQIPKGSLILISPYVIHRHPAFWPDNERFDPERFARDQGKDRPRHAYFPFGLGPRVCIGTSFALTEAVMVLASLIDQFDVEPTEGHVLTLDPNVTLRPKNGLPMGLRAAG